MQNYSTVCLSLIFFFQKYWSSAFFADLLLSDIERWLFRLCLQDSILICTRPCSGRKAALKTPIVVLGRQIWPRPFFSFTSWFNALEFRNQIELSWETGAEAGTRPTRNRKLSLRHSLKSSEAEKKLGMEWQRCPKVALLAVLVGERRNESKVLCTRYRTKISEKLARLHLAWLPGRTSRRKTKVGWPRQLLENWRTPSWEKREQDEVKNENGWDRERRIRAARPKSLKDFGVWLSSARTEPPLGSSPTKSLGTWFLPTNLNDT